MGGEDGVTDNSVAKRWQSYFRMLRVAPMAFDVPHRRRMFEVLLGDHDLLTLAGLALTRAMAKCTSIGVS